MIPGEKHSVRLALSGGAIVDAPQRGATVWRSDSLPRSPVICLQLSERTLPASISPLFSNPS